MPPTGISLPSGLSFRKGRRRSRAFTLVEVTLAIGIVAFAFIPLFGLIPTGLSTFRQAMDTSVGSQIAQRLINEAQLTDFLTLTGTNASPTPFVQSPLIRYFDSQGNELPDSTGAIYSVQTRIVPVTQTPYTGIAPTANANLATVTVQIASNPGHQTIIQDTATKLWTKSPLPIVTYSSIVSRNQ